MKHLIYSAAYLLAIPLIGPSCLAGEYQIERDVIYGRKAGMALTYDIIKPSVEGNGAGVVFIVSGGWFSTWFPPEGLVSDSAPDHGMGHFRTLLERGYTVFVVRHGSAPQFKVPDAVADVRRAIRHIRSNANRSKIDSDKIGVCGASAGGHLSLMLGVASDEGNSKQPDPIEQASDRVAAVVAYFPPVDLRELVGPSEHFPALEFDKNLAVEVSPLLFITPDDAPTLLVHGDKDGLVPLSNSKLAYEAFQEKKVATRLLTITDAGHGFNGDKADQASDALVQWFDDHLLDTANGPTGDASTASEAPVLTEQPISESVGP